MKRITEDPEYLWWRGWRRGAARELAWKTWTWAYWLAGIVCLAILGGLLV